MVLFEFLHFREEANELCQTLEDNEERSRTASEMADVLYHALVLLRVRDVKLEEVVEILRNRFSQSGIEEKKSRKSGNQSWEVPAKLSFCSVYTAAFWQDQLPQMNGNQTQNPQICGYAWCYICIVTWAFAGWDTFRDT